jgi:bacterioferritin B
MPISESLNAKLNEQIANEFNASQIYLAMACMFEAQGLKMLAKLFRKQTEEEREHALKLLDYLPTVDGKVTLAGIPQPPAEWPSVEAAIDAALTHERKVTTQINELMAAAEKDKDYATRSFLTWYVDEQVEEVDSMSHLLQIARMAGKNLLQLEAYVVHLVK